MNTRIKVGDVLSTNKSWSGKVVFAHKNEAVILSDPCEMLFVFNITDGIVENTEICVLLPPAPPEFDWSQVPEWMQIQSIAKDSGGAWFGSRDHLILSPKGYFTAQGIKGYYDVWNFDQSKLPASLREWKGDWKDSLIVRPGKGEG